MKRIISILVVLVMILGVMPVISMAATTGEFAGGSGTESDPYLISTKVHLDNVRNYLDAHFKLTNDIEFTDADFTENGDFYNNGQGFLPIGTYYSYPFTGTFDGHGHEIKNLYINRVEATTVYVGLFGYNKGSIKNLGVVDGEFSGDATASYDYSYVGGIAGYNYNGTIENCYNTNTLSGSDYGSYVGGITGYNNFGTVKNCYNAGDISADTSAYSRVGGIAGYNNRTIENCYNTGRVYSYSLSFSYAGGIAAYGGSGSITNCYNTGYVYASARYEAPSYGEITSKYYSYTITNCYSLYETTETKLSSQSTYTGFDFKNVWEFDTSVQPSPILRSIGYNGENKVDFSGGLGTEQKPYLIATKYNLDNVRLFPNAHFKLINDIDFEDSDFESDGDFYNDGVGFVRIAEDSDSAFTGVFDGDGYVISNLYMNISESGIVYAGLFGYSTGTIKNLSVADSILSVTSTTSSVYAGGLVGFCFKGSIINCHYNGDVTADTSASSASAHAAGIVGMNNTSIVDKCYSGGTINAQYSGGIASYNTTGATISECCNNSVITSSRYAGGIAGTNYGTITNCHNTAIITVSDSSYNAYAGGIVAYNNTGSVSYCYNTGVLSANSTSTSANVYTGGIVAFNSSARISDCYYLNTASVGIGNTTDTATKCTTAQMKQQSTFAGFDFENVWIFDSVTHDYPILKSVTYNVGNTIEFAGGRGTKSSPFLISDKYHLNNVRHFPEAYFKMISDVAFTSEDFAEDGDFYNGGKGFTPIGDDNNSFKGVFDGNGHCVKKLYINTSNIYAGLFGYNAGVIKNLTMSLCSISSTSTLSTVYAGGIVAYNDKGTISSCYNMGNVSASVTSDSTISSQAGGIVGYNKNGTIEDCYNDGSISAYCSSSSSSSSARAGGIAGCSGASITNCHNHGDITASQTKYGYAYSGGLVGYNFGEISDCYNSGIVKSVSSSYYDYAGGIAGYCQSSSYLITNCYYLDNVSYAVEDGYSYGSATKCNDEKMRLQETFSGFDFENVWTFNTAVHPYPVLKSIHYHVYFNACDATCNSCGSERTPEAHKVIGKYTFTNDTSYPFELNDGVYTSTNKTDYSSARATLNITGNGYLTISYSTSTESNCDILQILHNEDEIVKMSGENPWQSVTLRVLYGDKINIMYSKDGSSSQGADTVYFKLSPAPGTTLAEDVDPTCLQSVICSVCGVTVKEALGHSYSSDCDTQCATCGELRDVSHNYIAEFDSINHFEKCTVCGDIINSASHIFDNTCDATCNECDFTRNTQHDYNTEFNESVHYIKCSLCGDITNHAEHAYVNVCDSTCNDCEFVRTPPHAYERIYDNIEHYDKCSVCASEINIEEHSYDNSCDKTCNGCDFTRKASHSWGEWIYNESGATETRTCTSCGESETRDITENPTYRPDEHMPFLTLNESGNGVVLDHNKSWATRVYWGNIGEEFVEYKWFDEDFRLLCGTDYFADYSPKAGETYNFTKPGWYRFVVKGIRTGTSVEDYTYSELVFDFYYDGSVAPTVPTITELGNNQVKINTNGTAIKKFYYGNIGQTNVPYSWFNSFWGTALETKTYTSVFDNRDSRVLTLQTKGYYNIIIVDTNNNEYLYTVYADGNAPVIKKADGESKAIVDIDILKGNVGTKATMTKLYYGYLGTEDKEISTWADFTANVPKRVAASNVAQGTTYNLSNKGFYKFYAVMALSNGRTIEVVYTVDNN